MSGLLVHSVESSQIHSLSSFRFKWTSSWNVPVSDYKTFGDRSFAACAPKIWNILMQSPLVSEIHPPCQFLENNLKPIFLRISLMVILCILFFDM